MFSQRLRATVVAILVAMMAVVPATAAPSRALGSVVYADRAWVGQAALQAGATVYSGDAFHTESGGTLRIRIADGQVYLLASSAATLEQGPDGPAAQLDRGTVGFAATIETPLVVRSGQLLVRAKSGAAHGRVEKRGDTEFVVSSYKGELEITNGTETYSVAEASSYRVTLEPEVAPEQERQDPAGVGAQAAKRRALMMWWLGAAISATIITFVVLQNLSPELP